MNGRILISWKKAGKKREPIMFPLKIRRRRWPEKEKNPENFSQHHPDLFLCHLLFIFVRVDPEEAKYQIAGNGEK